MVHSMPATGDSKLQLKYDICGVSTNKFNSVYQILVKIINPKDDGWVLPHTMSPPRRGGAGVGGGRRDVQLPAEEQTQHMP